jgi:outer membrane lipoprotein-sorting protein
VDKVTKNVPLPADQFVVTIPEGTEMKNLH